MALESYESISSEETLVNELKSAIDGFQVEEGKAANEIIKSLNESQLTSFIEKSFKNEKGERLTYSQMKQNQFYPFMVQSAIDLLSDKLKDEKYDEDGKVDKTNGKTLDEWIKDCGGIDNKYGQGTRDVVGIVQNILSIHDDGNAGPQFFAKICSIFKGEKNVSDFKVQGYDENNKYKYNFDDGNMENKDINPEQRPAEQKSAEQKSENKKTNQKDIPDNWNEGIDCTEKTKDFINTYKKYLTFNDGNKKEYISLLASILNDFKKGNTLNSLMKLDHRYRGNFKLNYDNLKLFKDSVGSSKVDASKNTLVFKSCSELNDDYLTYRNGVLVRLNEGGGQKHAFEADGSHRFDDYRFDSVEGLFAFFNGAKIVRAKGNVRNLQDKDLTYRNNRFDNGVINNNTLLESIGNAGTKEGQKRRKTFISLLELPDRFWGDYKLTKNDINNFVKGMEKNVFDWRSGSASVFHAEGSHGKFEVDGTGAISDKNFKTTKEFFSRLEGKVK